MACTSCVAVIVILTIAVICGACFGWWAAVLVIALSIAGVIMVFR